MDVDEPSWEQLISFMEQECNLLENFAEASRELRMTLHQQKWADLESAFKRMGDMADNLNILEQNRIELTHQICGTEDFSLMVLKLEPGQRERINRVKSELKARLMTVKSRTEGMMSYTESRYRLNREMMEEVFPSTRGRIYNQHGQSASGERNPMLLSRHL